MLAYIHAKNPSWRPIALRTRGTGPHFFRSLEIASGKRTLAAERDHHWHVARLIGQCLQANGRDFAATMIRGGTAAEYCRYSGGAYGTC